MGKVYPNQFRHLIRKELPTVGAIIQSARQAVQQGCCVGWNKIGFMLDHGVCFD